MPRNIPVTFAESAIQDLEKIKDYYQDRQVPEVGDRFVREIIFLAEKLPIHPDRGRIVPEFNLPQLREMVHPPFRIIYRRDREKISIVRVWRSERLMQLP